VGNTTQQCGDINHIQPCAEGLDTGEQISTMDGIRSHTPAASTTPNANVDAHLYPVDARDYLPPYTPCQFDSFGNLETVTSAFQDFHLSINCDEPLAPTIVTAEAEPLCTQLDHIALGGGGDTGEFYDIPTDWTTGEDLYFFDVLDDSSIDVLDDGQTPEPPLVTPSTHIRRWMEKWADLTARTTKLLSFLMRRQIKFKVKESQHRKHHLHSSLVMPSLTQSTSGLTGMSKDKNWEGFTSMPTTTIASTLAINKMIDAMANNNRMFQSSREAMMHDTFEASYAQQWTDDDYVEGRSDIQHNWSLYLLNFLKKRHVKFRMIIQVLGSWGQQQRRS
jgi:hypothetical protein